LLVIVLAVSVSLALGTALGDSRSTSSCDASVSEASSDPSDVKVGSAAKEALQIGSEKAVELTRIRAW
jgi:hypothetical protein